MLEEDTKNLNDILIKVVAWMNNRCINKMEGVLLELVTGKEIEVSRLTINEDNWRDMEDEEVIWEIKDKLKRTMKDIQGKGMDIKIITGQTEGQCQEQRHKEGDKIWH